MSCFCSFYVIFGTLFKGLSFRFVTKWFSFVPGTDTRNIRRISAISRCPVPSIQIKEQHLPFTITALLRTSCNVFRIFIEEPHAREKKEKTAQCADRPADQGVPPQPEHDTGTCIGTAQGDQTVCFQPGTRYNRTSVATLIHLCKIPDTSTDYILLGKRPSPDSVLNARFNQFTDEQKEKILDTIEDVAQSAKLPGQQKNLRPEDGGRLFYPVFAILKLYCQN